MKRTLTICTAIALGLSSAATFADYDRAGFQLTGGIGLGQTDVGGSVTDTTETEQSARATFNMSVGYGLSDQLSIYLGGMGTKADDIEGGNVASIAGIGGSYHFSADPTSFFVTGLYGRGRIAKVGDRTDETSAPAWLVGAGYQFSKHLQMQATFMHSGEGTSVSEFGHDFQSTNITLNLLLN